MTVTREFLGWSDPVLPLAVNYLFETYGSEREIALDQVLVVVPGSRASRQLLEQLAIAADRRGVPLLAPQIITLGRLPEYLYRPERPLANDLLQKMGWVHALQSHSQTASHLPRLPENEDLVGWWELASVIWQQHRELGAYGYTFDDVLQRGQTLKQFADTARWRFLCQIHRQSGVYLRDLGFDDPVEARHVAVRQRQCQVDYDIVLVATADISRELRQMLQQVGSRVTSLVHAPQTHSDLFDDCGCIDADAWSTRCLPIDPNQLAVVGGPAEQGQVVVESLRRWSKKYGIQDVTVAVPDEQLVPELQRQLLQVGVPARWLHLKKMSETGPYRLLQLAIHYLQTSAYTDFASLLRHPDIEQWMESQHASSSRLIASDTYYREHLPADAGTWLGSSKHHLPLQNIHAAWETALASLRQPPANMQIWADRIAEFLTQIYGERRLQRRAESDHELAEALTQINDALNAMRQIPHSVRSATGAESALRMLSRQLDGNNIPAAAQEGSLEILGWLEVHLDTADALIVTTFNEGYVPTSVNADGFLPNALRKELGVDDNQRRLAHDAYFVEALSAARREVKWIIGRRDMNDNPLVPSRLAFACPDAELPARCQHMFRSVDTPEREPLSWACDPQVVSKLAVPLSLPLEKPVVSMSVTAFRDYVNCPYRFYLRHVLKLDSLDDEDEELSPRAFGDLVHQVLEQFGRESIRESTRESEIRDFLFDALANHANSRFGMHRLPAVNVQLKSMELRLEGFAAWQARRNEEGWQIRFTEQSFERGQVTIDLEEGPPMEIRGRIDRIDWHPDSDQWEVLDYKTSDTAKPAVEAHRHNDQWIDLQLPLYRFMVSKLEIPAEAMRLGYVQLPKDLSKIGAEYADWTEDQLQDAYQAAVNIARCVRAEAFWPPKDPPGINVPEFAAICGQRLPD